MKLNDKIIYCHTYQVYKDIEKLLFQNKIYWVNQNIATPLPLNDSNMPVYLHVSENHITWTSKKYSDDKKYINGYLILRKYKLNKLSICHP